MDSVTGKHWSDVTRAIHDNFQEASSCSFTPLFREMFTGLFRNNPDVKESVFLSGSCVEGSWFSGLGMQGEGQGIDVDLMYHFCYYKLSPAEQVALFKHVPGFPGYITIDITGNLIKMLFDHLNVTVERNGRMFVSGEKCRRLAEGYLRSQNTKGFQIGDDYDPNAGKASVPLNLGGKDSSYRDLMSHMHSKDNFSPDDVGEMYDKIRENSLKYGHSEETLRATESSRLKLFNQFNVDVVPAVECEYWPIPLAEEWVRRKRKWPPAIMIAKIIQDGFHVVPKASPGGDGELEWRISFSRAEVTLAECRTDTQKKCFYIFKTLYAENIDDTEQVLSSYCLKTIMLWATEQKRPLYWEEENIGQCVTGLLDNLLHAVITRTLPHYFTPQHNLISHIPEYSLQKIGRKIFQLRKSITSLNRQVPLVKNPSEDTDNIKPTTKDNAKKQFGNLLEGFGGKMNEMIYKFKNKAKERKKATEEGKKETPEEAMEYLNEIFRAVFTVPCETLEEQNLYPQETLDTVKCTMEGVGAALTSFIQTSVSRRAGRSGEGTGGLSTEDERREDQSHEAGGDSSDINECDSATDEGHVYIQDLDLD